MRHPLDVEDITWPHGDTKFLFECWKIFHEREQWTSEIFFSTREEKCHISKRPCFCAKAHLVNFIGVYIIKRFIHLFNNWGYSCFYLSFHSEELHTYHHCHYQPMYSTVRLQLKYLLHTPTYPAYTVNAFWYLLVRERMGEDKANVSFLPWVCWKLLGTQVSPLWFIGSLVKKTTDYSENE